VAAARGWLDCPWRHQGRSRDGIDCVGLVIAVGRAIGEGADWLEQPYQTFPPEHQVRAVLDAHLTRLGGEPEPGDVALLRWRRTPNHLAIVTDGAEPFALLHAYRMIGRVCEHRADSYWRERIVATYAFRSVEA
jgi:cell wall-associated NlpC family hydrolase